MKNTGSAKSKEMWLMIILAAIGTCSLASTWCADRFQLHYCMPQVFNQPFIPGLSMHCVSNIFYVQKCELQLTSSCGTGV